MAQVLNLRPEVLNLSLYAGDGISFRMICTDTKNEPIDVSGDVKAQIRLEGDAPDPPLATFSVNAQDAYKGIIVLSLTGDQTTALMGDPGNKIEKFVGVWDVQWTPGGAEPRTLCVGSVECVTDVTR
jgi:hypothetical protein